MSNIRKAPDADECRVGGVFFSIEDVIRIREKQFDSMGRIMKLAETDEVLAEQIQSTYKTDDLIAWQRNRLLTSPHPQFAKLREAPEYMEMLARWMR